MIVPVLGSVPRVKELWSEGVQIRTIKPTGFGFAGQHAEAWILDGRTLLTGSCNLTHGGIDNNIEHLLRITNVDVVNKALNDFELFWAQAEPVTQKEIDIMQQKWDAKKSMQRDRSVSRSLSQELDSIEH